MCRSEECTFESSVSLARAITCNATASLSLSSGHVLHYPGYPRMHKTCSYVVCQPKANPSASHATSALKKRQARKKCKSTSASTSTSTLHLCTRASASPFFFPIQKQEGRRDNMDAELGGQAAGRLLQTRQMLQVLHIHFASSPENTHTHINKHKIQTLKTQTHTNTQHAHAHAHARTRTHTHTHTALSHLTDALNLVICRRFSLCKWSSRN